MHCGMTMPWPVWALAIAGSTARMRPWLGPIALTTVATPTDAAGRAAVDILMANYKEGRGDLRRLLAAQRAFLKATLDLPQAPEKRLAALREAQEFADTTFKLTEAQSKVGTATQLDVLEAKAALLEARIELLREQAKDRPRK